MTRPVHFRVEGGGIGGPTLSLSQPTACNRIGFNVPDTDAVTCPSCRATEIYELTARRHLEVVEALSYPKEDHPCLTPHRRSSTS